MIIFVMLLICTAAFMIYEIATAPVITEENECDFCIDRWQKECPLNGGEKCPYGKEKSRGTK